MRKIVMFFVVLMMFVATLAQAGEGERKGFLIGVGPHIGYEAKSFKNVTGGAEFRIGGGFNEQWLLYLEGAFSATKKYGLGLWVFDTQAKTQFFFFKDLYANLGVGFADGEVDSSIGTYSSKFGFSSSAGIGYEFRLTKLFCMSPEVQVYYRRIEGVNLIEPMLNLHLGWYF